jgi:diadenosine tetraphosphate (Ap4A) HIT family hydrolase
MSDWRDDRVGAALRGENPTVLLRMRTGFAVIGDTQHLPGYCVLLHATPGVDHLSELPRADRTEFLTDMALLGEAVAEVCGGRDPGFRRVNYEILGNSLHHLHAHVFARYSWEPFAFRRGPVWRYPNEELYADRYALGADHDGLRKSLTVALERITAEAYP